MFSGIVSALGKVERIKKNGIHSIDLSVKKINLDGFLTKKTPITIGSSILCSGICLTVKQINKKILTFDVSDETIMKTNFSSWKKGTIINLERSLKAGDEIGGHFVSGHIDGVVKIKEMVEENESIRLRLNLTNKLKKFIAEKGSVALNGISLTVNKTGINFFEVNIIPFTWQNTNLNFLSVNSSLNIEIDLLSRYLINYNRVKNSL